MNIKQLSLAEKIGQMFICGFDGTEPSAEIQDLIQNRRIGGVIYFRRNTQNAGQVRKLSEQLQRLAASQSSWPLFICIDQEGGMVARIEQGVTPLPGNMALGATRNPDGVFEAAKISGRELRLIGINMNFAPCLDVNNNPLNPVIGVRSYGERADLVAELGRSAIRGLQQSGVSATVKHFPGHGDTETDSHLGLPVIQHDMQRLNELELVPFQTAIEEEVDAVMTAHIVFQALGSSNVPATLSYDVLTGLLKTKLGFKGLIVTDCLEMNAISQGVGTAEGAVLAVEAGADLLLVSHTYQTQTAAIAAVLDAVKSGRIPEQRIDEAVDKIIRLKEKRNMGNWHVDTGIFDKEICTAQSRSVAQQLSEQSITLIKDQQNQIPLRNEATYVIWTEVRVGTEVDEVTEQQDTLGAFLQESLNSVKEDRIGISPTAAEMEKVLTTSRKYKQIIFCSYNATFSANQTKLVQELASRENIHLIVIATRNPFDLLQFPEVKTYLASYENSPLAMRSLARVLTGKIQAEGKLPVSLDDEYRYGWSHRQD